MTDRAREMWSWVGGVAVIVVVMGGLGAVALKGCTEAANEMFADRTISGGEWCREQAAARPFIDMVDAAAIGGEAWPASEVAQFAFELGRTTVTGGVETDRRALMAVIRAAAGLPPAAPAAPGSSDRTIDPARLPDARAAALRLDAYCNAQAP